MRSAHFSQLIRKFAAKLQIFKTKHPLKQTHINIFLVYFLLSYLLGFSGWLIFFHPRIEIDAFFSRNQLSFDPTLSIMLFTATFLIILFFLFLIPSLALIKEHKTKSIWKLPQIKVLLAPALLHLCTFFLLEKGKIGFIIFINAYALLVSTAFFLLSCPYWKKRLQKIRSRHLPRLFLSVLPCLLFVSAFLLYCTFNFLDHYSFKTVAWDLGLYDQAVWKISTFASPENTIIGFNNLGDHFELPLFYLAPLYWIWSSPYVLLFAQSLALAIAIFPIYFLAREKLFPRLASAFIVLAYIFYFGIQAAIEFDFHPIVLVVPFITWAFYFLEKKNYHKMFIFLLLALITKEDVPLYITFFGIYLFLFTEKRKPGFLIIFISLVYFQLITQVIMPALAGGKKYLYFHYSTFGQNLPEAIKNIILNPYFTFKTFFTPQIKLVSMLLMFGSFAFFPLLSFRTVFLSLPFLLERFLSTIDHIWGPYFHYSAGIVPFLAIGAILGISNLLTLLKQKFGRFDYQTFTITLCAWVFLCSTILSLRGDNKAFPLWWLFNRKSIPSAEEHTNIRNNYEGLKLIAPKASVCAQNVFVPHLSQREHIYLLTNEKDGRNCEWVIINPLDSFWPIPDGDLPKIIKSYLKNSDYKVAFSQGTTILFKKNIESQQTLSPEIIEYLKN